MRNKLICLFVIATGLLEAHNNSFLPGDAFFSTSLTGEGLEKFREGKADSLRLDYQRLDNHFMACGNLGYYHLKVTGISESFRRNIGHAYERVRGDDAPLFVKTERENKEELVEWNPVVVLVYNEGKVVFPIGAKFNENWQEEGLGQYGGFLDDAKSVVWDWRRGKDVPPLALKKELGPKEHLKLGGEVHRLMDEVVSLDAKEAELVFVGILKKNTWVHNECPNLKRLAKYTNMVEEPSESVSYIRVTAKGATMVEMSGEGFVRSELNDEGEWGVEKKPADTE
jgi:hypothetical protein